VEPKKVKVNQMLLDGVTVTIEAFIGETQLTIGALNAKEVGGIVELSVGLDDAIDLRLNGVSVGRGELVAVGDKFAVKITELA
jgi:flagellar motor switch protein FliN/FliY